MSERKKFRYEDEDSMSDFSDFSYPMSDFIGLSNPNSNFSNRLTKNNIFNRTNKSLFKNNDSLHINGLVNQFDTMKYSVNLIILIFM